MERRGVGSYWEMWRMRFFSDVLAAMSPDPGAMHLKRIPNSIDTLSPNNRFVLEMNKFRITPGIPYHSIIGDRGRGDTPKSSDGVVAYWSSRAVGARLSAFGHLRSCAYGGVLPPAQTPSAHGNARSDAHGRRLRSYFLTGKGEGVCRWPDGAVSGRADVPCRRLPGAAL